MYENEFKERVKTKSNADLVKILENKTDFRDFAIQAAKAELLSRNLSDSQLKEAQQEVLEANKLIEEENRKLKERKSKVLDFLSRIFGLLDPIKRSGTNTNKIIYSIVAVFTLICIYDLYTGIGFFKYLATSQEGFDITMLPYLFSLLYLPVITFLFWKRTKGGWVLMIIYLTYSIVNHAGYLLISLNMQEEPVEGPLSDLLAPSMPAPGTYFLPLLFFTGTFWIVCKNPVRSAFNINDKIMRVTIGITAIISTTLMIYISQSFLS